MKNQKLIVIITSIAALLGFALATFLYQKSQNQKLGFLAKENAEVFVRPYSPSMGPDDAKVYLVEFLDPECESCRQFYPAVKQIMKSYQGKIKLVIRYAPFHGNSKFVVTMLEASRKQNLYWELMQLVFQTQPAWGSHHDPKPELLWQYIKSVQGLDIEKLREDMKDPAIQDIIAQDEKDLATLEVRKTPTFFVNGKRLMTFGYYPLLELIENELKED